MSKGLVCVVDSSSLSVGGGNVQNVASRRPRRTKRRRRRPHCHGCARVSGMDVTISNNSADVTLTLRQPVIAFVIYTSLGIRVIV